MGRSNSEEPVEHKRRTMQRNSSWTRFRRGLQQSIHRMKVSQLNRQGVIPEELAALTYLAVLKIDQNAFTGTLPPFLGNFSDMVILSLAHNRFFGTIPKELGNLKELAMLAVSSNNFSGSLPPELGNLVKMQQIYLDSSGVGGEIPSTFANLTDMLVLWASDSPFSGKIPPFIGTWTKLDSLVIRNALVAGPVPTDINQLQDLHTLDLSFNNLNGSLPQTLMNMSSLFSLFLGNNSLSGSLLTDKSENLQNIDLSYNQLSGSFPRWVIRTWSMANLQLNLVVNNFRFDSTNISTFPGLHCLQRGFPCNRNTTPYSSFAIKCGGSEMRSMNNILFETENDTTIGPASYYLFQEKWAVSSVGIAIDRSDPSFIASTSIQVDNTRYPELYRTSRKSPGSLRYYGLGMENGPYTISLFFAETVFNRTPNTWQGHGRRVFDIYIQGNRRQKDFDISKEAGGVGRALVKDFDVNVTQNYLEIHLFWAGKGTCYFKVKSNSNKTGMIIGVVAAVTSVSLLLLVFGLYMKKKRSKHGEEDVFLGMGPKVKTCTYAELRTATADFSSSNLLGEGGFGPVYKV
ncbi:hypothetical protein L1987_04672 [Smallanthus sonchifolius]|uniref:Uncharacterized protein n=1 Tax=Smallanthus sonchifolius TaxID=185202 RepID=A0ACB9JT88_9ASTR|nr:hypothetical protein L1987_04672 [Smallanthus sonchifolius]